MITAVFLGVCIGLSPSSAQRPWLGLGRPVTTATTFEASLGAPLATIDKIERHVVGKRIVLFVPGVTAVERRHTLPRGPVAQVNVVPALRGAAITLVSRIPVARLRDQLQIERGPSPSLRVAPPAPAVTTADEADTLDKPPEPPRAEEGAQSPDRDRFAAPVVDRGDDRTRPLAILGLALLAVAVVAAAGWWRKRHRRAAGLDESIDVVAVRSFGGKQKLMLVDTCGDRLLLAACDKEVKLLKEVGDRPTGTFGAALTDAQTIQSAAYGDVAGLLRLRAGNTGRSEASLEAA